MAHPIRRPALDRSRAAVLDAATRLLLESPELSLAELAARIGIGRTTLHRMFPTREAVLVAVAHDAIDHLAAVHAEAGLRPDDAPRTAAGDEPSADPLGPVRRLVDMLVPLGPRLMFLLRATELRHDVDLDRRFAELDEPLARAVQHAQRAAALDPGLPVWWIVECLYATVYIAWEQVERGRLAAHDAAPLVLHTWLDGTRGPRAPTADSSPAPRR